MEDEKIIFFSYNQGKDSVYSVEPRFRMTIDERDVVVEELKSGAYIGNTDTNIGMNNERFYECYEEV